MNSTQRPAGTAAVDGVAAVTAAEQQQATDGAANGGGGADDWRSIYVSWVEIAAEVEDVDSILNYTEQEVVNAINGAFPADRRNYLFRELLPNMIRTLMKKDYSGATAVMLANSHQNNTAITLSALSERINLFLRRSIDLIVAILSRERIDELIKVIEPMFDGSAMIYLDSDQVFDEQVRGRPNEFKVELSRSANGPYARMPADGSSITSLPLINNLNYFGSHGGFDMLINLVAEDSKYGGIGGEPLPLPPVDAAPPSSPAATTPSKAPAKAPPAPPVAVQVFLERVAAIQATVGKITHYLQPSFIDALAARLYMIMARRLLRMDDEEIKQVKKPTIDLVFNSMKLFLKYGTQPTATPKVEVKDGAENKDTPVELLPRAPRLESVPLRSWSGVTPSIFTFATLSQEYYASVELLALELAHRFLSSTLPKQVQGVNDIRAFIDICTKKDESTGETKTEEKADEVKPWITSIHLISWINANSIAEILLSSEHNHIIEKANGLLYYMSKHGVLQTSHIQLLWDHLKLRHEGLREIILQGCMPLVHTLNSPAMREFMFSKICEIPLLSYDAPTIRLVFAFVISTLSRRQATKTGTSSEAPAPLKKAKGEESGVEENHSGLKLLWALVHDEKASQMQQTEALKMVQTLLVHPNGQAAYRDLYMQLCLDNLRNAHGVPPSLLVLRHLIKSFPVTNTPPAATTANGTTPPAATPAVEPLTRAQVIEQLQNTHRFISLVFTSIARYKERIAGQIIASERNIAEIKARLDFLRFVLQNSTLRLSREEVDLLWQLIVEQALDATERDLCLGWITSACPDQLDAPAAATTATAATPVQALAQLVVAMSGVVDDPLEFVGFSADSADYLFLHKLPTLSKTAFSLSAFTCLDRYFRFVNGRSQRLGDSHSANDYTLLSIDLQGVNPMWELALQSNDNAVKQAAVSFLTRLYLKPLDRDRDPMIRAFLNTCMAYMKQAYDQAASNMESAASGVETKGPSPSLSAGLITLSSATSLGSIATRTLTLEVDRCLWLLEQYLAAYSVMKASLVTPLPTATTVPNAPTAAGAAASSSAPDAESLDASTAAMMKDITLIVEVLQGEKFLLRMSSEKMLLDLKQNIANRMDVPMNCMRVIANAKELKNDTMTLAANGLANNTKVTAIKRPGKAMEAAILAHRQRKLEGAHNYDPTGGAGAAPSAAPTASTGGVPTAPPLSATDAAAIFDQPPPSAMAAATAASTATLPPATAPAPSPAASPVTNTPAPALGPPPGWLLIHTHDYFHLLFDILRLGLRTDIDAGLDVTGRVWNMLATMPTNSDLERQLTTLVTETKGEEKKDGATATVVAPNWSVLLDTSTVFKLLYSLKIVEKLLYQGDQSWARSFLYTGGLHRVYAIIMTYSHHMAPSGGIGARIYEQAGREALQIMLRIITAMFFDTIRSYKFFVFNAHPILLSPTASVNTPEFVKWIPAVIVDYPGFLQKICSFAIDVAATATPVFHPYVVSPAPSVSIYAPPSTQPPQPSMNGYIAYLSMNILTSFLIYGADEMFQAFNSRGQWGQIVLHSLFSVDKSVRSALVSAIHQIVVKVKYARMPPLPPAPTPAADGTVPAPAPVDPPTSVLDMTLPVLWQYMPTVTTGAYATRCEDYFRLLCLLLHEYYGPNNMVLHTSGLFQQVWQLFMRYNPTEITRSSPVDPILCGLLDVIRTLIHLSPVAKSSPLVTNETDGVIAHVFGACLFDRPSFADRFTSRVPKCRTAPARLMAYSVLLECTRHNNTNWHSLVQRLLSLYTNYQAPSSWQYSPAENERSAVGYAGMRNPGCVCYMNSSLQQLFHIPEFRTGVIQTDFTPATPIPSAATTATTTTAAPAATATDGAKDATKQAAPLPSAPAAPAEEDKDFFYELQTIFSNLAHSDRKHADPLPFCLKYTNPWGEPVNISEQMDANEFLNFFFDKLETKLKTTPNKALVQSCFGGVLSNQIICEECNTISERPEGFMSLSVQTKGKKTLQEGLSLFVAGESLSGSNKYNCSKCAKKVNAVKRTCVKTLPPHLIVQMKRFSFDYDTMQKFKLNDACEFPMILDMFPYTQAALAGEGKTDDNYQYELTGIVVHSGIAEAGHYYSYIRERLPDGRKGEWFEFNDSEVTPFNPDTIPDKCYGGQYWWNYWDQNTRQNVGQWMPKTHNAYLLVYDRIEKKSAAADGTTGETKTPVLSTELLRRTVMNTVPVPSKIEQSIFDDNAEYSKHAVLFDQHYYTWIWDILHVRTPVIVNREYPDGPIDPLSVKDVQLAIYFVLETLARAKDKGVLKSWVEKVNNLLRDNVPAAGWFLNFLTRSDKWTIPLFLTCPEEETRRLGTSMITTAVRTLIPFERRILGDPTQQQVVLPFIERAMTLILKASPYWRQFGSYFNFFREFALLGTVERSVLLNRSFVSEISAFLLGAESPILGPKAKEAGQTVVKPVKMGTQYEVGQFGDLIETLAILVCGCSTSTPEQAVPTPPTAVEGRLLELPAADRGHLFNKELVIRLLKLNVNHAAVGRILQHWSWYNKPMSTFVINVMIEGIAQFGEDSYSSVFIVLGMLLDLQDAFSCDRTELAIPGIIESIRINLEFPAAVATACRLLHRLSTTNNAVSRWFLSPQNRARWAVIETQLSQAAYAATQPAPQPSQPAGAAAVA